MNRLIIIGNGFDLAHGMKTSYYDFLLDYLKNSFSQAIQNGRFKDNLIDIYKPPYVRTPDLESLKTISDYISSFKPKANNTSAFFEGYVNERFSEQEITWIIQNKFIKKIFIECHNCGWVDIENEYYNTLKIILKKADQNDKRKSIGELNSAFCSLKELLENYLSKMPDPELNNKFDKFFFEKIRKDEIVLKKMHTDEQYNEMLVLNFNYTKTIIPYFDGYAEAGINYIHGMINHPKNPLIFGFGDELDGNYSAIESEKVKGFLHYIKSFWYFRTSNYHDLIRFIDSDEFQVQIFGHSCGLSDRTMLNMIFEHTNCVSIKIFYHQIDEHKNNYSDLTEEISRHFKNKGIMRKKIVPFNKSSPMPQTI